jgi:hypothetical protein
MGGDLFLPIDSGSLLIGDPVYLMWAAERCGVKREEMDRVIREAIRAGEVLPLATGKNDR